MARFGIIRTFRTGLLAGQTGSSTSWGRSQAPSMCGESKEADVTLWHVLGLMALLGVIGLICSWLDSKTGWVLGAIIATAATIIIMGGFQQQLERETQQELNKIQNEQRSQQRSYNYGDLYERP
jgi:type VI protein secretion system component VasF